MQIDSDNKQISVTHWSIIAWSPGGPFQGDYVWLWVPELQTIRGADVHTPWILSTSALSHARVSVGETYPTPIVIAPEWSRHVNSKLVGLHEKGEVENVKALRRLEVGKDWTKLNCILYN